MVGRTQSGTEPTGGPSPFDWAGQRPQNLKFEPAASHALFTAHGVCRAGKQSGRLVACPSLFSGAEQQVPHTICEFLTMRAGKTAVIYGVCLEEPRAILTARRYHRRLELASLASVTGAVL